MGIPSCTFGEDLQGQQIKVSCQRQSQTHSSNHPLAGGRYSNLYIVPLDPYYVPSYKSKYPYMGHDPMGLLTLEWKGPPLCLLPLGQLVIKQGDRF